MKSFFTALAFAFGCAAFGAWAQSARVEAVQYPAWLERGGQAVPLRPGMTLQPRDRLRTGGNARVQLRLGEGSAVKLGENARFVVERVEDRGIFKATLSVIAGAFRFTGQALGKKRDIAIKIKNTTAGIRGTDLWGKSTDERDIVCLIEGRISVGSQGHPEVTLDQPLDFYQKPRDGAPQVAKVDPKQLEEWARETEIAPDGPAARTGGKWRVVAAVLSSRDQALKLNRLVRSRGFPSEVGRQENYFTVQVSELVGEAEARAVMASLRGIPGVELPLVRQVP